MLYLSQNILTYNRNIKLILNSTIIYNNTENVLLHKKSCVVATKPKKQRQTNKRPAPFLQQNSCYMQKQVMARLEQLAIDVSVVVVSARQSAPKKLKSLNFNNSSYQIIQLI